MSDIPQGYSHIGLDKGYIEPAGQTLSAEDYPELYQVLNQTLLPLVENYTKSKQVLDQEKKHKPTAVDHRKYTNGKSNQKPV